MEYIQGFYLYTNPQVMRNVGYHLSGESQPYLPVAFYAGNIGGRSVQDGMEQFGFAAFEVGVAPVFIDDTFLSVEDQVCFGKAGICDREEGRPGGVIIQRFETEHFAQVYHEMNMKIGRSLPEVFQDSYGGFQKLEQGFVRFYFPDTFYQ